MAKVSALVLSFTALAGCASAASRNLLQAGGAGGAGAGGPGMGKHFKADMPCGNGMGQTRTWTWRLTGPFAPKLMEITSGVDMGVYEQKDISPDGFLHMAYPTHKNGELMCTTGIEETAGTVWLGGQMFMHNGDECLPMPTKADGSSCCSLIIWHPDGTGNYQTECSGTINIKNDGLFWFETVIPGNECTSSWGADCGEHVHYAMQCDECKPDPKYEGLMDFDASPQYLMPNKYYVKEVSKEEPYAASDIHVAVPVETPKGTAYSYTMVFGMYDRDESAPGAPPVAPGGKALGGGGGGGSTSTPPPDDTPADDDEDYAPY